MKKLLFVIFALFACVAYADNVITSKSYVDSAASGLQEQISANDANTVLTYTGTAGEIGEKGIYDSSAAYGGQQDALVTAGAFNTAVQNALDSEFVCVERQSGTNGCLLYEIRAATQNQSPNVMCEHAYIQYASFDATTGIFTNTAAEPKNYINLYTYETSTGRSAPTTDIAIQKIYSPTTIKRQFTTTSDSHYIYIKHNDSQFDVGVLFPLEPSTTYTLIIRAIETNPSIVGGMKLQLMMVRGEYDSDEFIPCGNVYIPQEQ